MASFGKVVMRILMEEFFGDSFVVVGGRDNHATGRDDLRVLKSGPTSSVPTPRSMSPFWRYHTHR